MSYCYLCIWYKFASGSNILLEDCLLKNRADATFQFLLFVFKEKLLDDQKSRKDRLYIIKSTTYSTYIKTINIFLLRLQVGMEETSLNSQRPKLYVHI